MQLPLIYRFALALILFCSTSLVQAATKDCVFVLMHGKWGGPQSPYLKELAKQVSTVCEVELREMPWSRNRNYDETYESALNQLAGSVKGYRIKGYRLVFIGGQSFGANAAMAYQAYIGDADSIIALAPGHSPSLMYERGMTGSDLERAQKAIADGKPDTLISFTDLNQGRQRDFKIRADVFWSYFNPNGLGNMTLTAEQFKKSTPFMWVIGRLDPLYSSGPAYAFDRVPPNPNNTYVVVSADHATTPEEAAPQVLSWVKKLSATKP